MACSNELSLKLLVDTKSNKVLLAEADKEFVDFLFSLLAFPVGAVVRLNSGTSAMHGSVGTLYQSVVQMRASYLQPSFDKSDLLLLPVTMPPHGQGGGYVKAHETFVVTDGLEVTPMPTISNLALVDRLGVHNEGVELAEKIVAVGAEEVK